MIMGEFKYVCKICGHKTVFEDEICSVCTGKDSDSNGESNEVGTARDADQVLEA